MDKKTYYVGAKPAIERLVMAFEKKRDAERRFMATPWGRAWAEAVRESDRKRRARPLPIWGAPRRGRIQVDGVDLPLDVFVRSRFQSGEA